MICPHCNKNVINISGNCPSCGGYLYDEPLENPIDEQEYIYSRLLKFGIKSYKDDKDILEKGISDKDKLFLQLKEIDIAQENNNIMKKQENHLHTIKNILVFFVVLTIIAIIIGNFIWRKNEEKLSKHSYSYEQNIKVYKDFKIIL